MLIRYRGSKEAYFADELDQDLKARAFCYHPAHPLPLAEYEKVFCDLLRRFAESEKGNETVLVFDGSLLHHQINDLMRNYDASKEQIAAQIGALARTVAPLNPMVFCLSAGTWAVNWRGRG